MANAVCEHDAFIVLMHSKQSGKHPHVSSDNKSYKDIILEITEFLEARVDAARSAGIKDSRIILDPGIGAFTKPRRRIFLAGPAAPWTVFCKHFSSYPFLIGTSRKGFLGGALKRTRP